jgi:glyceraldehyde-3-phosphate dehydrogenase/erythrose-4-phosphate dehydrogenase
VTTRIGIHGFGRIGRALLRRCLASSELVRVFGWYDNVWDCTRRLVDLSKLVAATL